MGLKKLSGLASRYERAKAQALLPEPLEVKFSD